MISISHRRLPNLGDQICRPGIYFDLQITESIDWLARAPLDVDCLIGGGGVVDRWIVKLASRPRGGRLILWGTGWVSRQVELYPRPNGITLYGSRDWQQPGADAWVPCSSCTHPALDQDYAIEREVGAIWNPDFQKPQINDVPFILNTAGEDEIFSWIGSSETLLTNSYHCAYWGLLIGRRVIVIHNPVGNVGKFLYFHPSMQPQVVDAKDWRSAKPVVADGALELCREANRKFYRRVQEVLWWK